jgi:hypothetical protein
VLRCDRALAAADFAAALAFGFCIVFDAFDAAGADVRSGGEFRCVSALPAALFAAAGAFGLASVFDAAVAAFFPVSLDDIGPRWIGSLPVLPASAGRACDRCPPRGYATLPVTASRC